MHFGILHHLRDSPVYNPSGYMQVHPAYNISQNNIYLVVICCFGALTPLVH